LTFLAMLITEELHGSYSTNQEVVNALTNALTPKSITYSVVEWYVRRALRNGSWRLLSTYERALLRVVPKVVKVVKSPALAKTLRVIFLKIELNTVRGRALYYGLLIALRAGECITNILNRLSYLLALGINYLNNPPIYRIYG